MTKEIALQKIKRAKQNMYKILNLSQLNLTELPEAILELTNLTWLSLGDNQLNNLPESIGKMNNLTFLNLHNNQLNSLPKSLGKLDNLKKLYLSDNLLINLPKSIEKLNKLKRLDLENNQLSNLPNGIEKLTKLRVLDLRNNKFKFGPEIYNLSAQDQITEILKWQKARQENKLIPIYEAKVIFIGQSNYGKTHLVELLREGEITREIKTTHGIERNKLHIEHQGKSICLNLWDLGGQEFMRSTHQFFFSERTLYVLVTLARTERSELNHWLKLANQLGNNAPVLIVINKIDMDSHDLDRMSLQRDYPNIIGFARTSINNCGETTSKASIENLLEKIKSIVGNKEKMPSVFEQRRPEWFTVKKELENLEEKGIDYISYKEYEALEHIRDLPADERKRNLHLLSILGTVVSYVDDPRLIDTNVINPQWIMDGVYKIINDPTVKDKNKGRFHIKDLKRILDKERFPKDKHYFLLELLQKFNLCYPTRDNRDVYLIPDLFEDIEPELEWDDKNAMHFRYNYDDFPPNAFMTKFIVEMHEDIMGKNRWRSGVYISNGSCEAKVYQGFRRNMINIEIIGKENERRRYLYAIRQVFRGLHKPFPKMKVIEEVCYKDSWIGYQKLERFEDKKMPFYHDELDEIIPVTEILNGYSTPGNRKVTDIEKNISYRTETKTISIFLASSKELEVERKEFEIFINRENKRLNEEGVFISLEIWEDFIDAMSQTRLQNEYNKVVRQSDIFVSLFFTKVGKFTAEEFEIAFGQFKDTGRPLIYTYFKDAPINSGKITDEFNSLLKFKDKLKDLGHFAPGYTNVEDLQLQFKKQLEKVLPSL